MTQPIFTKHHLKMNREIAELRNRPETAQTKHPHPSPTDELHIFNPDHNLFCETCGLGELAGNHGINGILDGQAQYESDAVKEMYETAWETTGNDFYRAVATQYDRAVLGSPATPETARDLLRDIAVWLMAPSLDPETLAVFR